jgi:SAM-dependent methyltransferase
MPSATVPTRDQSESDVLDVRASVWRERPLLREIYRRYFAEMVGHFSCPESPDGKHGVVVEVGGGSGNFKEYFHTEHPGCGSLITTDIVATPHCDRVADATALPFPEGSVDNLVMLDVLHHLPYPLRFFSEAARVLRPGGRLVMTEPYISPASRVVFALVHPEPVNPSAVVFGVRADRDPSPVSGTGAFASNQATPTRIFFRDRALFVERFPSLRIVVVARRSLIVYPLSGGFSGPKLLPRFLEKAAWALDSWLSPLAPLLAFRLVVVLEQTGA